MSFETESEPKLRSSLLLHDRVNWIGPAITAATILLVIVARSFIPIPSPGLPLLVTIAASAVLGGISSGLASSALLIVFVSIDASAGGPLFIYQPSDVSRIVLNGASAIAMAVMVGAIRQRLDIERDRVADRRIAGHERALTETATDAMITTSVDGTIRSANPATEVMFGHRVGQLIGRPIEDLLAPPIREAVTLARRQYVDMGIRTTSWANTELTGRRANGEEFPMEASFGEYDGSERYFTWIVRDVSIRKSLEEQLLQAQKMEAIGQLAGGVAHDFNNMLTAIGGFAELIADDPDDRPGIEHSIEGIRTATERAAGLTRQLLAFSRRQRLEASIVSLNGTVERIEPLLRRLLGEHIELVTHRAAALWPVLADPSQLETVVINLAINARDAMPDGGTLVIETANIELDELYAEKRLSVKPGPYVMLSVHDTGAGMAQETIAHVFEPFFTTKEVGQGTGLGLSSAYGVVKQSGGDIWVYSEPGKGTTFKVYLPKADGVVAEPGIRPANDRSVGSGTIVVAEDESVVRDLIVLTLERQGYRVLTAEDGQAAVELFEREGDGIDLLISDVVMPHMGGLELVDLARVRRPALPVLLISGYSERLLPADSIGPGVALLEKPFTARRLTEAIGKALGPEPGGPLDGPLDAN